MPDTKQLLRETRDRIAPPPDVVGTLERRRRHKERVRRVSAAVVGIVVALVGLGGWFTVGRDGAHEPVDPRPHDLGIFSPGAGRIAYQRMVGGHPAGLYAVDPAAPGALMTQVQLIDSEDVEPLGWSSDGTELLVLRTIEDDGGGHNARSLYILHADGSETRVTTDPLVIQGATISPDGSRVVFAGSTEDGRSALYAVDADDGRAVVLLESVRDGVDAPTYSPDGTQIAYVERVGDYDPSVWVMDADGSDAHQIVSNEATREGFEFGLAWSPAGDRIALGLGADGAGGDRSVVYTFVPDGSDLTRVITGGYLPYWSPDGSQIAYTISCWQGTDGCPSFDGSDRVLAVADADGSNARVFGFAASGPWHPAPDATRAVSG